jgi:hypothetical protein
MQKEEKFVAWMQIKNSGKAPPSFERWTDADKEKLLEAQSDIVEMAHTALGHLEQMKKKELALAAMTMSQEEFDQLVEQRNALIAESVAVSGDDRPNPGAPIPAADSIAHSKVTTGDDALAGTSGDGEGVAGG